MKDLNCKKTNVDVAITLLHILGTLMIFLCHATQVEHIYFLSEIFISGVPLFLFVSGYLAGRKEIHGLRGFFLGKIKRILVPFWVFVLIMYSASALSGIENISPFQWIFTLLNLQGLNYSYWKFDLFGAIGGCGHLWYITTLMFCYLLVPAAQKLRGIRLRTWVKPILILGVLAAQLGLMYLGFQMSYIITFFFGYFLAGKEIRTDFQWFGFVTLLTAVTLGARLAARQTIDGTDFYDRYFALISAAFIAIWIFFAVYFLLAKCPRLGRLINCKAVRLTERISYYFYLTHYMFLRAPLSMFAVIKNRPLAHLVAFACSCLSAMLLCLIIEEGLFKLFKRRRA